MQVVLQTLLLTLLGIRLCHLRAFCTQSNPTCAFYTKSKAAMNSDLQLAMKQLAAERQSQDAIPAHYALQQQWFEHRASRKRAAPTPQETPIGTPHPEMVDETMEPPPSQAVTAPMSLFQPIVIQEEAAAGLTAASAAEIDPQDVQAVKQYFSQAVASRAEVFQIVRGYHLGVIRPELYNLVVQVESVVQGLDDRLLRQQQDTSWLLQDSRQAQKQACGLQLLLSGFENKMTPNDRLYQIDWMLSQVAIVRNFVEMRGWAPDKIDGYPCLNALSMDPVTPPASNGHSGVTILHFKAWDVRQAFLDHFGGTSGTPLYWDPTTPVPNKHIRCSPSSPQFQRKLEAPLRVILQALNQDRANPNPQLTILWKTLTVMSPQSVRAFDPQAEACARLHYVQDSCGTFTGRLEVTATLLDLLNQKTGESSAGEEQTVWQQCWFRTMFGNQLELDEADRMAVQQAVRSAKGTGKGIAGGKGSRHWTNQHIHFHGGNPFPLDLEILSVEQVAFCWDEYCDKFNKTAEKVGDYAASTYIGRPAVTSAQAKSAPLAGAKGSGKRAAPTTPTR